MRQFWLHNETILFADQNLRSTQFVLLNPHYIFPYKIQYDVDNWRLLIDQLYRDPNELPTLSRMQLIVDAETFLRQSDAPELYLKVQFKHIFYANLTFSIKAICFCDFSCLIQTL